MSDATTPTTNSESNHRKQQVDQLERIREKIDDCIDFIDDLGLKQSMREWLADSYSLPSGSVNGHVQHRLSEMEAEYPMRNSSEVSRGGAAFPDECQGCPAYGGGCPIVTHPTPQDELERIAGSDEISDRVYKLRVRRLARDYNCHRLPEFIAEFESEYADQIKRGYQLLEQTDFDIYESATDEPTERVDVEYDGPGADNRGEI